MLIVLQKALAQRGLPIYGTEFELLTRLEDALEKEEAEAKAKMYEAKDKKRSLKVHVATSNAALQRAEVLIDRLID